MMEFRDRRQGDLGEPLKPGDGVFEVDTSVWRHSWVRPSYGWVYMGHSPQLTMLGGRVRIGAVCISQVIMECSQRV